MWEQSNNISHMKKLTNMHENTQKIVAPENESPGQINQSVFFRIFYSFFCCVFALLVSIQPLIHAYPSMPALIPPFILKNWSMKKSNFFILKNIQDLIGCWNVFCFVLSVAWSGLLAICCFALFSFLFVLCSFTAFSFCSFCLFDWLIVCVCFSLPWFVFLLLLFCLFCCLFVFFVLFTFCLCDFRFLLWF